MTTITTPQGGVSPDSDPFTSTSPSHSNQYGTNGGPLRYATFDQERFSLYSGSNSPSHAKRALEAHLKETDRRIQGASRLGTNLVQQRQDLAARLKEVEQLSNDVENSDTIPEDLLQRLVDLEKEYNELGRETARAILPKSTTSGQTHRVVGESLDPNARTSIISSHASESPAKVSAPSRRQRNQPVNRVHDIEFAAEISTSLLAQVRQLQAALVEKDQTLKDASTEKARLEAEASSMLLKIRQLDESEQRYKDANWELETRLQDLEASHREVADKEQRQGNTLKSSEARLALAIRDLEELKAVHARALEDHNLLLRQQDADLNMLRRDATIHDTERARLLKQVDEVKAQNAELAKAVASTWRSQSRQENEHELVPEDEHGNDSGSGEDDAEFGQVSPVKGTPARNSVLEYETVRSSLNHAHRMIQNLKSNIHREKSEKIELRRMLAEARDELESSRRDGNAVAQMSNTGRKRAAARETDRLKKSERPNRLGATRPTNIEIFEDEPDWEDDIAGGSEGLRTPSKASRVTARPQPFDHRPVYARTDTTDSETAGFQTANETEGFETANDEREGTATETDAFHTGTEGMVDDESSDNLTETEGTVHRQERAISSKFNSTPSPLVGAKAGDRASFMSTASTSADEETEDEDGLMNVRTPQQNHGQPRYRLRMGRGGAGRRKSRNSGSMFLESPVLRESPAAQSPVGGGLHSPSSSRDDDDTPDTRVGHQTLGEELEGLEDESFDGTPSTMRYESVEPEDREDFEQEIPETPTTGFTTKATHEPVASSGSKTRLDSPISSHRALAADAGELNDSNASFTVIQPTSLKERPPMVDADMMTEPWTPENTLEAAPQASLAKKAVEVVSGTVAGFGLGRLTNNDHGAISQPEESIPQQSEQEQNSHKAKSASNVPVATSVSVPVASQPNDAAQVPDIAQDQSVARFDVGQPTIQPFEFADVVNLETEPIEPVYEKSDSRPTAAERLPIASEGDVPAISTGSNVGADVEKHSHDGPDGTPTIGPVPKLETAPFEYSTVLSEEFAPELVADQSSQTLLAKSSLRPHGSRQTDTVYIEDVVSSTAPQSGVVEARLAPTLQPSRADEGLESALYPANGTEKRIGNDLDRKQDPMGLKVAESGQGPSGVPNHLSVKEHRSDTISDRQLSQMGAPFQENSGDREHGDLPSITDAPRTGGPLQTSRSTTDDGAQTMLSGTDIQTILRSRSRSFSNTSATGQAPIPVPVAAKASTSLGNRDPKSLAELVAADELLNSANKRPTSAGSSKNKAAFTPPLPLDHSQKIAAAQKTPAPATTSSVGTMGPPLVPASAYKKRPTTPNQNSNVGTKEAGMSRPLRGSVSNSERQSEKSRATSISSFASEVDERLRPSHGVMYPEDIQPSTDPRMIQAITQTMIGEFLWKYTRKAGRSEVSNSRHKRFFWVHPYTRTLYWSEHNPSTASRDMMKAKSVAILSVRVITDDNAYPPGLHRKSLVVVTPGREIVFTAPTGQRHETWFNALSYLLLRTEREKAEAEDEVNEDDLDDFNPGGHGAGLIGRSISRMTGRSARSRSRTSLSSYNSRTTRASSPHMYGTLAHRKSQTLRGGTVRDRGGISKDRSNEATIRSRNPATSPALAAAVGGPKQANPHASTSSRLSNLTAAFRPQNQTRGSFSGRKGATSALSNPSRNNASADTGIYDASVVSESAEDLREIIEQQEREAMDRLEDVRACCDGKHHVGSLTRNSRHTTFGSRFGGHTHGHSHHTHSMAEPHKESQRQRRGE